MENLHLFLLRYSFILFSAFLTFTGAFAQVEIVVKDQQKAPVPGAYVQVKWLNSKTKLAVTDAHGTVRFDTLSPTPAHPTTLEISHLGFLSRKDTLTSSRPVEFILEDNSILLNQVVITGQYSAATADQAMHRIQVLDRKDIDDRGAVNLRDMLEQQANVRVSQDAILGSGMTIQGLSGNYVKVLIDGVPVIGRLGGNIDLSQINLNSIERIEIVEGPLAVQYGTDALAGTINLITKKDTTHRWTAGLNSYYESVGQYNLDGQLTVSRKNHRLSLSGGRNYFDGWNPGNPSFSLPQSRPADLNRIHAWNPKEQYFANAAWIFTQGNWSVRPFASWFEEKITNRGTPRLPFYESAFDDAYTTERRNLGVDVKNEGAKYGSRLQVSYDRYDRIKNSFFTDLTTLEQQLTTTEGDQDTSDFTQFMVRAELNQHADSSKLNWQVGFHINQESGSGRRITEGTRSLGDYAVFSTAEWKATSTFSVRPGLRWAYNTVYAAPVVPSLHLRWKKDHWQARAAWARGFRAPSIKELYFEFVDINHNIFGNPDLKAESADHFDLQIKRDWISGKRLWRWETNAFYNQIEQQITLAQEIGTTRFSYFNVDEFRTLGIQSKLVYQQEHFKITAGGGYTGLFNALHALDNVPDYNYTPEGQIQVQYKVPPWATSFNVFYRLIGARNGFGLDPDQNLIETQFSQYELLDFTVSRPVFENRIQLALGAKNLFDVTDVSFSGNSGVAHSSSSGQAPISWGRSYFIRLSFNLQSK